MTKTKRFEMRARPVWVANIDAIRGSRSRAAYIEEVVEGALRAAGAWSEDPVVERRSAGGRSEPVAPAASPATPELTRGGKGSHQRDPELSRRLGYARRVLSSAEVRARR